MGCGGRGSVFVRQAERWLAGTEERNLLAICFMVKGLAAYAEGRWAESLGQTATRAQHCFETVAAG